MTQSPLEIRYYNTLHGFQLLSAPNIAIAFISKFENIEITGDSSTHITAIKEKAGAPPINIEIDDFVGHVYLKTRVGERSQIPRIINACVAAGYSLKLCTRLETKFRPDGINDLPYTIENSEKLAVAQLRDVLKYISSGRMELIADERMWKTEEGKAFAREARRMVPPWEQENIDTEISIPEHENLDPNIDFPLHTIPEDENPKKCRRTEAVPAPAPAPAPAIIPHADEEDEDSCTICCDAKANTLVLPCNHSVVCKACSEKLRSTRDNATCLRCRQRIELVLWDGGSETKPGN